MGQDRAGGGQLEQQPQSSREDPYLRCDGRRYGVDVQVVVVLLEFVLCNCAAVQHEMN